MPAPAWEGRQGAVAALVSRGTTVPLPPTKTQWLGTSSVNNLFLETPTSVSTGCTKRHTDLALLGPPPPPHTLFRLLNYDEVVEIRGFASQQLSVLIIVVRVCRTEHQGHG